jgi:DNA polymerase III alpha subunit (gram-positive type)
MKKFLILDTETGGVTEETSLLTAFYSVLDENLNSVASLDLKLKPRNGLYFLDAGALKVNRINIVEHDAVATTYDDAKTLLYDFISTHSDGGKNKLIPIGHNVHFDIKFTQVYLVSKKTWDNFISYRTLDTGCVAQFLIAAGVIDGSKTTGSMESLAKYFGVDAAYIGFAEAKLHDAEYDSKLTVAVLRKMQEAMKSHYITQAVAC